MTLVVGFFVLFGVVNTLNRYLNREQQALLDASQELARIARDWEQVLSDRASRALEDLAADPSSAFLASRERAWRERDPWLGALFVWRQNPGGSIEMLHPQAVRPDEPQSIHDGRCVRSLAPDPLQAQPQDLAAAWGACRFDEDPAVRLFSATQLAFEQERLGQIERAWQVLDELEVPDALGPAAAAGFPPGRVALRQLSLARYEQWMGRTDQAAARLRRLGADIAEQPGPALEELLSKLRLSVIPMLEELGHAQDAAALSQRAERAELRLAAWREVQTRLTRNATTEPGLFAVSDPYGQHPFLLVYERVDPNGPLYGALQVDPTQLIAELARAEGAVPGLVVLNREGELLLGEPGEGPLVVETNFPGLLGHLRLGFRRERLRTPADDNRRQTATESLSITVMGLMGVWALGALRNASRKEAELLERQREFVTRVTHELKTPLAGIRVMAENLEILQKPDPALVARFAGRIVTETDRLTSRIEEILAIARARSLDSKAVVDLNTLLAHTLAEWEPRMKDAGVALVAEVQPVPTLMGDPQTLRDAVVCLLDNALKYRSERPDPQVRVSLCREGREVVLEVADNGIGVPPNKRKVIFQRFSRVEGPDRGHLGGHGLGLAFVAEAVSALGGRVECRDGLGGGARFVVHLPYA